MLSLMVKDHKPCGDKGIPKTWHVCGASESINGEMSECVSTIVEALAQSLGTEEVMSSEELLSFVDELVQELEDEGEDLEEGLCVGSIDTEALYPSLDISECAGRCRKIYRESDIKVYGEDMKWATKYVALTKEQHQVTRLGN